MSQYGYEYGQPHGYYPPPQSQQVYPTYSAPSYPANGPGYPPVPSHGDAAIQSYEYNRNVIPGLDLNLSNHAIQPQASGFIPPPNFAPSGPQPLGLGGPAWEGKIGENDGVAFAAAPDASEDGEVSEGELEDIYEPRDIVPVAPTQVSNRPSGDEPASTHNVGTAMDLPGSSSAQHPPARERSGSYSPYLSPHEIQEQSDDNIFEPLPTDPSTNSKATAPTVSEARKQAQDAISHLWPLNVRFHHYIEEGIDGSILEELFKELGFDVSLAEDLSGSPAPKATAAPSPIHVGSDKAQQGESLPTKSAEPEAETSQAPKDQSETRKDRIARLLAAKGKSNATTTTVVTTASPKPPNNLPASKIQSEKSRLLQQKMEALEKAREASARRRSLQHDSIAIATSAQDTASGESDTAMDNPHTNLDPSQPGTPGREVDDREAQPGTLIPGLFLSPTSKTSQPKSLPKRPVAADFDDSASGPFKRPFGQTRDSRPFLINVSDDEDDEEMDIDSTGQRSPSTTRPASPPRRTGSFRDHPGLSNQIPSRQLSSPGPMSASPAPGGKGDLESMNKKIEAMKRKIAEAEARKKAKVSQDGSPAPSLSNEKMQDGAPGTTSSIGSPIGLTPTPPAVGAVTISAKPLSFEGGWKKLPKQSDMRQPSQDANRRSRSRAASERLPLIEAHRREQLLKLQTLQAQIASIEEEIAANMKEESRLREEVVDSSSDQEPDRQGSPSEPPVVEMSSVHLSQASPRTDAAGNSTGSSDDADIQMDQIPHLDQAPGPNLSAVEYPMIMGEQVGSTSADSDNRSSGDLQAVVADQGGDNAAEEDSEDESSEDVSDGYEPPEPGPSSADLDLSHSHNATPAPVVDDLSLDTSDNELPSVTQTSPVTQQISTGQRDSVSESGREVDVRPGLQDGAVGLTTEQVQHTREDSTASASASSFAPYETPLQYFRAYRFHPQFNQSVAGGLRSLTYSNKLDVRKPLCPDQLAGNECPRGSQCEFQHFENIQAPDDQILLELGADGNYEAEQRHEYINGLRQLLTDFRNRKVKDFKTISEGIIDYRARFHGDKTKVLPLGNITL